MSVPVADHIFDKASYLERVGDRLRGSASEDYWAFIGPFCGITTATLLRAAFEDRERTGDPLAITANCCGPVARHL